MLIRKVFATRENPVGPDMAKIRRVCIGLSGSVFEFFSPPHSTRELTPKYPAKDINIYDPNAYGDIEGPEGHTDGYRESWRFFGRPILEGSLGYIDLAVSPVHSKTTNNLFDPTIFEHETLKHIDNRFHPENVTHLKAKYRAPLNYKVVEINNTPWVKYEVETLFMANQDTIFVTPISSVHYIQCTFHANYKAPGYEFKEAFDTFVDQVSSTFKLTLSSSAMEDKKLVGDIDYTPQVDERPWSKALREEVSK